VPKCDVLAVLRIRRRIEKESKEQFEGILTLDEGIWGKYEFR